MTAEVLDAIRADKQLAAGDRQKALELAERKVLPHVNFTEAARFAVGPAWLQATPAQQAQLALEFRRMLIRVYSRAITPDSRSVPSATPIPLRPVARAGRYRSMALRIAHDCQTNIPPFQK